MYLSIWLYKLKINNILIKVHTFWLKTTQTLKIIKYKLDVNIKNKIKKKQEYKYLCSNCRVCRVRISYKGMNYEVFKYASCILLLPISLNIVVPGYITLIIKVHFIFLIKYKL